MTQPVGFSFTIPVGAGGQPAGLSPAGTGVRAIGQTVSVNVFPDPVTGLSDTGRLIDPLTGGFDFNTDGLALGMQTMPQIVLLVAADLDFSSIDVAGGDLQQRVLSIVANAFALYVNRGMMAIVSILVTPIGVAGTTSGVRVQMQWRDLTTAQQTVQTTSLL